MTKRWFTNDDNVVLHGFDVVSYFVEDRAVLGGASLSAEHDGVTFYFSSAENRDAFRKNPEKYAPAFGGWCAYAISEDPPKLTPPDPRTFKLYNGELLVFLNDLHEGEPVNTKVLWQENERQLMEMANRNWKTMNG
jgi:YHS domain-containing protein